MRTKIIYIVSSDENDYYLEQTLLSVYSLRKHNPDAVVELVVDHKTDSTIKGNRIEILKYVNRKIVILTPSYLNKVQTSRFLKTSLRNIVEGDFLYIDSDTVITDKLDEIDNVDFEIGAVQNWHASISYHYRTGDRIKEEAKEDGWECGDDIKYYNGGVLYVKDTDRMYLFFKDWQLAWMDIMQKTGRHYDQSPLALINERYGYLIEELPGIWNCQILKYGIPYLHNAKIIHYYIASKSSKGNEIYSLRHIEIYRHIRKAGHITEDISILLDNAKSAFSIPARICTEAELNLLSGEMAMVCQNHPKTLTAMNSLFKLIIRLHSCFF